MKISHTCFILAFIVAGFVRVHAQPSHDQSRQFWNDPEFRNRFMGTYGQLSDVEPRVSREEAAFLQGMVSLIRDNPQQAVSELRNANRADSTAVYDFALGNIYFQEGNTQAAREAYLAAIRKHPDFRRVHKNLGLLEVREGNWDKALEHLSKSAELGDKDSRTYGLMGYIYLQQGKFLPSESAYRQAILYDPGTLDWKLGIAQALVAQERHAEAITLFDQLIAANPSREDFWLLQANAYLASGAYRNAAANLEMVRQLGKLDANSYVLLGDIYLNEGMSAAALASYREVLALDAKPELRAPMRSAAILVQTQAYDEASTLIADIHANYEKTMTREDRLRLLNLEARLAKGQNNKERGAEILGLIVEEDPLNGEALLQLADYHASRGEAEKAVFLFERVRNIQSFEASALLAHAQFLVKNADYREALVLLNRALALNPSKPIEDYRDRVERAARTLR